MHKEITAFIIHKGTSWYLDNTLNSLERAGWGNIVILGDKGNSKYSQLPGVRHVDINTIHSEHISFLQDNYYHLGVTPPDYEKFCFLRWVYLEAIVKQMNLNNIMLIDSDVLFFASPEQALETIDGPSSYFVTRKHNPSCFISNNAVDILNNLARFIAGIYRKSKEDIHDWVSHKQNLRLHTSKSESFYAKYKNSLHFSDMDMLEEFWEACSGMQTLSAYQIEYQINQSLLPGLANPSGNLFFDSNFASVKTKNFYWKKKVLRVDDKLVSSLHFQGMSKRYISIVDAICNAPIDAAFSIDINDNLVISYDVNC